jgi:hypothetical protein
MSNNNAFIDAVLCGAGGGAQTAWLQTLDANTYNDFKAAILEIATAVDGLIPPMLPGPSLSQINLLQSITGAVMSGRFPQASSVGIYADIATRIVLLYNKLASSLNNVPNVYGGGVSLTNLTNTFFVDASTSVPLTSQTGNIESPFSTVTQALLLCTDSSKDYTIWTCPADYHLETFPAVSPRTIEIRSTMTVTDSQFSTSSVMVLLPTWNCTAAHLVLDGCIQSTSLDAINLKLTDCSVSGVTVSGILEAYNTDLIGITSVSGNLTIEGGRVSGRISMSTNASFTSVVLSFNHLFINGSQSVRYTNCTWIGSISILGIVASTYLGIVMRGCVFGDVLTVVAPAGLLNVDASSYSNLVRNIASIGVPVQLENYLYSAILPITLPALPAGYIHYADIDPTGTSLSSVIDGQIIGFNPTADFGLEGVNGAMLNCRVYYNGTISVIRCAFIGPIADGTYNIQFWIC